MRKSENPMLRRTSKSKHRKAKYKVQGSNPSQGRPEWLRSTRTTTMANKCDCTSFLPSQLFASPQQTPFHSLVKAKIQNLNFWFLSKMRVLHVLYEMSRMCGCDVHDAIVCWKSFQLLCGSFDLDENWRNYCSLKFRVVSPLFPMADAVSSSLLSSNCSWNFSFVDISTESRFFKWEGQFINKQWILHNQPTLILNH